MTEPIVVIVDFLRILRDLSRLRASELDSVVIAESGWSAAVPDAYAAALAARVREQRRPMAKARSSKRMLEKARHDKAVAKRERRDLRIAEVTDDATVDAMPQDQILAALAAVHERYADGGMSLDDFEAEKEDLVRRLQVD